MATLADRLANPTRVLSLPELANTFQVARIEAVMPGYGFLANDMDMLRKLRGALGTVLVRSASRDAQAGRPCPWQPPCALDVMFREQLRLEGRHGLPKPWVLAADRHGGDLVIIVSVFGMAIDWAPAMSAAIADALVHGVRWDAVAKGTFLPKPQIAMLRIVEQDGVRELEANAVIQLRLRTPLDAEGKDARDEPATILSRLARRIDMLARWQDAIIGYHWPPPTETWLDIDYELSNLCMNNISRRANRGKNAFDQAILTGAITMRGATQDAWWLLRLAELTHVGRGGTSGFGRVATVTYSEMYVDLR